MLAAVETDEEHQATFGQLKGDAHQVVEIVAPGEIVDRLARVVEPHITHHLAGLAQGGMGELIVGRDRTPFGGKGFGEVDAAVHPALRCNIGTRCGHLAPPGRRERHQLTEGLQAFGDKPRCTAFPRQPSNVQHAAIERLQRGHGRVVTGLDPLLHHCDPVHCMVFVFYRLDDAIGPGMGPAHFDISSYNPLDRQSLCQRM